MLMLLLWQMFSEWSFYNWIFFLNLKTEYYLVEISTRQKYFFTFTVKMCNSRQNLGLRLSKELTAVTKHSCLSHGEMNNVFQVGNAVMPVLWCPSQPPAGFGKGFHKPIVWPPRYCSGITSGALPAPTDVIHICLWEPYVFMSAQTLHWR